MSKPRNDIAEVGDEDFQTWKVGLESVEIKPLGVPVDPEVLRVLVETVAYWHGKLDSLEDIALRYLTDAADDLYAYLTLKQT